MEMDTLPGRCKTDSQTVSEGQHSWLSPGGSTTWKLASIVVGTVQLTTKFTKTLVSSGVP